MRTAGSDLELMQKQHLDANSIRLGVLTGVFHPAGHPGQFEFSTALCSAYNDWLVKHWLEQDRRLRGSIQILPQDPAAAAREIDRVGANPSMVQVMMPLVSHLQIWGFGVPSDL